MQFATDRLVQHVQGYGYRTRPFITDLSMAPQRAERFDEQLFFGVLGYEQHALADARTMLSLAAGHAEPAGDAALFYLGLTQARLGDGPTGFDSLLRAFGKGMRLPPALLEAACLALHLGDEGTAVALFRQLIASSGDQAAYRQLLDMAQLRAYNRAFADFSPRVARLLEPCALLGRAEPTLAPRAERTLGALLDASADDFAAGRSAAPPLAQRWQASTSPTRARRVLFVFARHINCSERFVASDVLHHLEASAQARGHAVEIFRADRLLYGADVVPAGRVVDGVVYQPSPEGLAHELARLRDTIETFQPDLLLFEANFVPTATTLSPEFFARLPSRAHFALVAVVPDLYDSAPDFAAAWPGADRVLCFNEHGAHAQRQRDAGRLIYFPNLPFQPNPHAGAERVHDFVFAGGLHRGRDAVLASIAQHVASHRIVGTDRSAASALAGVDDFYRFLAQGKVTFNTGWLKSPLPAIQTGRTIEAMLARTALLEESSSALERACVPWVHFVPVEHTAQAVAGTQFLASHAQHRERLVDAAQAFVQQHYSPDHFWTQLETLT